MNTIILKNATLFDGHAEQRREGIEVYVEAGEIKEVSDRPIDIPLTRSEIADYLGLRTETVSRAFGRLKAGGLLALPKPKQIVILDRPALEALAKGRRAR